MPSALHSGSVEGPVLLAASSFPAALCRVVAEVPSGCAGLGTLPVAAWPHTFALAHPALPSIDAVCLQTPARVKEG